MGVEIEKKKIPIPTLAFLLVFAVFHSCRNKAKQSQVACFEVSNLSIRELRLQLTWFLLSSSGLFLLHDSMHIDCDTVSSWDCLHIRTQECEREGLPLSALSLCLSLSPPLIGSADDQSQGLPYVPLSLRNSLVSWKKDFLLWTYEVEQRTMVIYDR